jgi:quercetin dioxygenase-like cupin family protein
VPLAYFFLDGASSSQVVRPNDRPTLQFAESSVKYQLLTHYPGRRLACMMAQLPPGTSSFETPQRHNQEECVFVLEGALEVLLGSDTYTLEQEDSIHFDGIVPHLFTAVGDKEAVYLLVISPLVV